MAALPIQITSRQQVTDILNDIDFIITDCDGVLWLVNNVINNANLAVDRLRQSGKQIIFATNNSTKSRATLLNKIQSLGFNASENEIMVPSYVCGAYLLARGFRGKVYVFGSAGIEQELQRLGINYTGFGPDPLPRDISDFSQFQLDDQIEAVIVGFDYDISYPKMIRAATYAQRVRDDMFIATNRDATLPTTYKHLQIPGTGVFVKAIEMATNKTAVTMGKPEATFFESMKVQFPNLDPKKTMMIGDRLDTDIAFAHNSGIKYSLLVQSGVSNLDHVKEAVEKQQSHLVPTHVIDSLGDLLQFLN